MKFPIQNKIDEYKNPEIRKHLEEMGEKCDFYRGVRGDGNCFYRAIGYIFFETIIQDQKNIQFLENLIQEIKIQNKYQFTQIYQSSIPQDLKYWYNQDQIVNSLLKGFKYLYYHRNQSKDKFEEIFYEMINLDMQFDFSLVILIRTLAIYEFDQNQEIKIYYPEKSEQQKERLRLQTYGEEAQLSNLDMTYKALKTQVFTHQIDKNQYTKMESGEENTILQISLFFRPGHYDICYLKQQQIKKHKIKQDNQQKKNQKLQTNEKANYQNQLSTEIKKIKKLPVLHQNIKVNQICQKCTINKVFYQQLCKNCHLVKYNSQQQQIKSYEKKFQNYVNTIQKLKKQNNDSSKQFQNQINLQIQQNNNIQQMQINQNNIYQQQQFEDQISKLQQELQKKNEEIQCHKIQQDLNQPIQFINVNQNDYKQMENIINDQNQFIQKLSIQNAQILQEYNEDQELKQFKKDLQKIDKKKDQKMYIASQDKIIKQLNKVIGKQEKTIKEFDDQFNKAIKIQQDQTTTIFYQKKEIKELKDKNNQLNKDMKILC